MVTFQVYYSWNNGQGITHGHLLGQREELAFDTGEIIITIIGCADSGSIVGLTFVTNKSMSTSRKSTNMRR